MARVISKCPVMKVNVSGQSINCLLDTGAEVSTLTEEFFRNHLSPLRHKMKDITGWIPITAANGLPVSNIGLVFKDVFLVTRNPI